MSHCHTRALRNGLLLVAALTPLVLLVTIGCQHVAPPAVIPVVASPPDAKQFAGNAACAECHPDEFRLHKASRHAATLRRVDAASLGDLAPPPGPIPGSPYHIAAAGGGFKLVRNDRPDQSATLQYALGSGKTVMTYVGETGKQRMTEFAMSYRPGTHTWYVTPGQEQTVGSQFGVVNELGRARKCILCHAVQTKSDINEPAPGFLGVGCESCHGPGAAHIAAVRTPGATDFKMPKMRTLGASRINAICARCHRSTDVLSPTALEANSTARFQLYGLEMSACFKKSGDTLSCVTCHNPHTDASTDHRTYERVCLSCHTSSASSHNKACPVNPQGPCIGCHMPKEQVFAAANIPISMADHLIWAYRHPR